MPPKRKRYPRWPPPAAVTFRAVAGLVGVGTSALRQNWPTHERLIDLSVMELFTWREQQRRHVWFGQDTAAPGHAGRSLLPWTDTQARRERAWRLLSEDPGRTAWTADFARRDREACSAVLRDVVRARCGAADLGEQQRRVDLLGSLVDGLCARLAQTNAGEGDGHPQQANQLIEDLLVLLQRGDQR